MMKRILTAIRWTLREPSQWRVALLLFLVLVFSLTSTVSRSSGDPFEPPEKTVEYVLDDAPSTAISTGYPFLFPLISVLVTLNIGVQRESGGLAALRTLGLRRWEIFTAQVVAICSIPLLAAFLAFLLLPLFAEPALIATGNLAALYPGGYWVAMPRLFLAVLFISLFAATFAIVIRRSAVAFGAMVTFFFVGWYLQTPLGIGYRALTPPGAFSSAYSLLRPLPGVPLDPNHAFVLYVGAAVVAFLVALGYASWRGEL